MTNFGFRADRPGEFQLIAELFAPLAAAPGAFDLTDDAAVLASRPGHDLVVTTDAVVAGVHFLATDPPELIAQKALRVNLSDLAAKGSTPAGYLLALCLPPRLDMDWLRAFAKGLADDQGEFGISLYGGDTTATSGPLTIAITAFGHVRTGTMLRRQGARPGDLVFVSGTIGDAAGGLACLRGEAPSLKKSERDFLVSRFQRPEPRVAFGKSLLGTASAALDVSDGLFADLGHIAGVSTVRIVLDAAKIPQSQALTTLWPNAPDRIARAATAGDDYEIAFTVSQKRRAKALKAAAATGTPVSEIGHCEAGKGVVLLDSCAQAMRIPLPGYVHF
jgi:thiamine-monophosphate kinase